MKQNSDFVLRSTRAALLLCVAVTSPLVMAQPNHRHTQKPPAESQQQADPEQQWAEWSRARENSRSHYGQGYESRQNPEAAPHPPKFQGPPGGVAGPSAGRRPGR